MSRSEEKTKPLELTLQALLVGLVLAGLGWHYLIVPWISETTTDETTSTNVTTSALTTTTTTVSAASAHTEPSSSPAGSSSARDTSTVASRPSRNPTLPRPTLPSSPPPPPKKPCKMVDARTQSCGPGYVFRLANCEGSSYGCFPTNQ